ncbi:MAG: transketolase [Planctomycetes bacterium]|nr:transketolase [Planctomycetota bacterium]
MEALVANYRLAANVIRGLAMDAVQRAQSGHPGMPMGMADLAVAIWLRHLRYDAGDPAWRGRDRFVLSAGHGSMLLYSLLHLAGFDLSLDDLRAFRQLGSRTPGHPEVGVTPGVETTTGPLGQGFANGVGMALAARMEAARFDCPLADRHRIVAIVSDGDLMEGVASEAASLAGHLALSNLVYFYDANRITIDGSTSLSFSEDVGRRFQAYGWRVLEAADPYDPERLLPVLDRAFGTDADRPTLVVCRGHIGYGSPHKQDHASSHGAPLGTDEVRATKLALGLPADEEFHVPDEVRAMFAEAAAEKAAHVASWRAAESAWRAGHPDRAAARDAFLARTAPDDLLQQLCESIAGKDGATRSLSGKLVQTAAALLPGLVGGSADLEGSCKTRIEASGAVARGAFTHRNIHFGVREHAMGAILNGMALHGGFLPMGSTFLVFADYCRPAIRLAALMGARSTFVFSHDSLYVGEDGPTHQPVEQCASLRLIPGLHVFRPADGPEVAAAWTHALTRHGGPTAILLTRQNLPLLQRPGDFTTDRLLHGGHVVREVAGRDAAATLVATGSEVHIAVAAAELLDAEGLALRVVSMPCLEVFLDQPRRIREAVLPPGVPVVALELGRPESWCVLTGGLDRVIGLSRFGRSAPWEELQEDFGFTAEAVAEQVRGSLAVP